MRTQLLRCVSMGVAAGHEEFGSMPMLPAVLSNIIILELDDCKLPRHPARGPFVVLCPPCCSRNVPYDRREIMAPVLLEERLHFAPAIEVDGQATSAPMTDCTDRFRVASPPAPAQVPAIKLLALRCPDEWAPRFGSGVGDAAAPVSEE